MYLRIYLSFGSYQIDKQRHKDRSEKDYGYIDTLRESMISQPDPHLKAEISNRIKSAESERDYFTATLRPIKHLIQIDRNPNLELVEPRWELYKVSISFQVICKFDRIEN